MAIDALFLDLLVCPENHEKLSLADAELVARVNNAIRNGLNARGGARVGEPVDALLVRTDGRFAYTVRNDLPNLVIEDGIGLDDLPA